jgi:hypothetical protein
MHIQMHINFLEQNEQQQLCKIWGFHSGRYEEYHHLGCDAV